MHANQLRQVSDPVWNTGRVNLQECLSLAHLILKSHVLASENQKLTIFVVSFMITVNTLANTGNKMLTNHHPLPNYIYLDDKVGGKEWIIFLKRHFSFGKDEIYSLITPYSAIQSLFC